MIPAKVQRKNWVFWTLLSVFVLSTSCLFLVGLGDAFIPLVGSWVLAYLLFPLIEKFERWGLRRSFTMITLLVLVFIVITIGFMLLIPKLVNDTYNFVKLLPSLLWQGSVKLESLATAYGIDLTLDTDTLTQFVETYASRISMKSLSLVSFLLNEVFSNLASTIVFLLNVFLFPLFFFYIVSGYEVITSEFKALFPKRFQGKLEMWLGRINMILSGYIRGQLLVAACLGVLYAAGLLVIKLPFGALVGVGAGFLSVIPYVGVSVGVVVSLALALIQMGSLYAVLGVIVVFGVAQTIEGYFLTPKLVGNRVGLGALATLLAVIVGGNLLGLWGLFLAIPIAGIVRLVLLDTKAVYQNSSFYQKKTT